jgi:hypothetical protein
MSHVMSCPRGHAAWLWSRWAVRAATAAGLAIDHHQPRRKKAADQDRVHSNSDPQERQCSRRRYRT